MAELTPHQIASLVELLDARQQEIESSAQEHAALRRDNRQPDATSMAGDMADLAEIEIVHAQETAAAGRDIRELRNIQIALARVDTGEAGICNDCGDEIGFDRLHVQPTAGRCIYCQNIHEQISTLKPNIRLSTVINI